MDLKLLFGLVLLLCSDLATAQQFKIMTYNIHHGADVNNQSTLDSMGHFIQESVVDIVGLQEVDSVCHRSGAIDQPVRLGALAGMDAYFTRHFPYQGGAYGQGLLTTQRVTRLYNLRLPVFPLEDEKEVSVLVADIKSSDRKKLTVAVVHLDYRSSESRIHQIDLLLDSLNGIKNLVLMGDFNAYPDSPEMQKLARYFDQFKTDRELPPSFPAEEPDRRIDFILLKKGSDLKIVNEVVNHVPYSDHLPVTATLEWQ